jgi:hypothetical protein
MVINNLESVVLPASELNWVIKGFASAIRIHSPRKSISKFLLLALVELDKLSISVKQELLVH